jgi:two-component sensor histidine kinase
VFIFITYRYFQDWKKDSTVVKKDLFLVFFFLTIVCGAGTLAGTLFAENKIYIIGLLIISSVFVTLGNAVLGHLFVHLKFPHISAKWGFFPILIFGTFVTIWTAFSRITPVLEMSGGVDWGLPLHIDLLRSVIYFLGVVPISIVFLQKYFRANNRFKKSQYLFLIMIFIFALLVVIVDFIIEPLIHARAALSEIFILITAVVVMFLYFLLNERILSKSEKSLRAALKEKEVLLQEIHHRVKNNIQIMSSLFRLQFQDNGDENIQEKLKESQNRLRSMALIHEKLYRSKDFSRINFGEYIRNLIKHLHRIYYVNPKKVQVKTELEDILIQLNTAVPLGLLINELVSNSFKHAFPGELCGEANIRLNSQNNGTVFLEVTDNGVGFPEHIDFQNPETLGLQLIRDLTKQINGQINLDGKAGTSFTISFSAGLNNKKVS